MVQTVVVNLVAVTPLHLYDDYRVGINAEGFVKANFTFTTDEALVLNNTANVARLYRQLKINKLSCLHEAIRNNRYPMEGH